MGKTPLYISFFFPLMYPRGYGGGSSFGSDIQKWMNQLIGGLIKVILKFLDGLSKLFLNAIGSVLSGFLSFFGIPFHQWAINVSQQGLMVPIIFVAILMFAGLIFFFFYDVIGIEQDVMGGEKDVGRLEEGVEEEE